jgi:hypothetical protein
VCDTNHVVPWEHSLAVSSLLPALSLPFSTRSLFYTRRSAMSALSKKDEGPLAEQERVENAVSGGVSIHSIDGPDKLHDEGDAFQAQQLAANWIEGSKDEKDLVRKLDWRILPCTWVLYLLGYLDRANIRFVISKFEVTAGMLANMRANDV